MRAGPRLSALVPWLILNTSASYSVKTACRMARVAQGAAGEASEAFSDLVWERSVLVSGLLHWQTMTVGSALPVLFFPKKLEQSSHDEPVLHKAAPADRCPLTSARGY